MFRAAVAGVLVALVTATPAAAASAGSAPAAYWWQLEPVTGLIPAPGVPAGGLFVASTPSGTQAEAALRITTPTMSGLVRLTLRVAQRADVNGPAITAFPVTSSWQPGGPQPWSARPSYKASAPLGDGRYNAAQTRMSLVVPAGALDRGIVLVPSVTPGAHLGPTFAISFYPPQASEVSGPPAPSPTTTKSHRSHPTSSASASPSRRSSSATPTPTHSRHRAKPTHQPSRSARPSNAAPTPSTAAPSASATNESSNHDGRTVAIVIGAVLVVTGAGAVALRRRRMSA